MTPVQSKLRPLQSSFTPQFAIQRQLMENFEAATDEDLTQALNRLLIIDLGLDRNRKTVRCRIHL